MDRRSRARRWQRIEGVRGTCQSGSWRILSGMRWRARGAGLGSADSLVFAGVGKMQDHPLGWASARVLSTKTGAAGLSVVSNSVLIGLKVAASLYIGSVSVMAEAIHSGVDLLAAVIAFASVRVSGRPPDHDHQFGHGKIESVSGAVEGGLIFVAAALIVKEAVEKLISGPHLGEPALGAAVMAVSAVTNTVVSRHLHNVARRQDSLALEADAEHLRTDVITSLGVFGGLILVRLLDAPVLDPLLGLMVAALIVRAAWNITHKSLQTLIDSRLPSDEYQKIESVLAEHGSHFLEYHRLRTRKSGAQRYIALDLVFNPDARLADVHDVCDHVESEIRAVLPGASVQIHVEPPGTLDR